MLDSDLLRKFDHLFSESWEQKFDPTDKLRPMLDGVGLNAPHDCLRRYVSDLSGCQQAYGSITQERFAELAHAFCTTAVKKLGESTIAPLDPESAASQDRFRSLAQPIHSFRDFLNYLGFARHIVAKVAGTSHPHLFGALRFDAPASTPLDPSCLPDLDFDQLTQTKGVVVKGSAEDYTYTVNSGEVADGILGTKVGQILFNQKFWIHSANYRELMLQADRLWLKILGSEEESIELPRMLGVLYHVMSQGMFYHRGSAADTQWAFNILCDLKGIEVPDAVAHLDCYAISMPLDLFLEKHFFPMWNANHQCDVTEKS